MRLFLLLCTLTGAFAQMSPELNLRIQEALCEVQCLKVQNSCSALSCSNCTHPRNVTEVEHHHTLSSPEFLCRTQDKLGFRWAVEEPMIFIIELKTGSSSWSYVDKTACSKILIDKLTPRTDYQVRLWGVSLDGIFGPSNSSRIRTSSKEEELDAEININPPNLFFFENNRYTATIEWNSTDPGCVYDMAYLPMEKPDDYRLIEVTDVKELFRKNISGFQMGEEIYLQITNIHPPEVNEWKNNTTFAVPDCTNTKSAYSCPPPKPAGITIMDSVNNGTHTCNIHISWSAPELQPDNYTVEIYTDKFNKTKNVSGNETAVAFEELPLPESSDYHVYVRAWLNGKSSYTYQSGNLQISKIVKAISSKSQSSSMHVPVLVSTGCVLVVLGFVLAVLYRHRKLKKSNQNAISNYYGSEFKSPPSPNLTTEYYIPEIIDDEWQLHYDQVVFENYLDEGAFGIVHKGLLSCKDGKQIEVAIKTLKGNPTVAEIRQFESEITIMKSVGSHPHLVSLLGCYSKLGPMGPFLVVEYCAKGALQTYLRKIWEHLSGQVTETRYINDPTLEPGNFSNRMYELFDDSLLEPRDLLSFARQIVLGMEYLSSLRVVHRDLATRNVLMCSNRTVKVADFGLSRDVYQDNIYTKIGTGKLPVKWMALESLTHQKYTTQSDVWSFGITLWEIITLGGNPYSAIATQDLLGLLKSGYRMECPKNCSDELYHILKLCWRESPKDRPTFSDLRKMLEKLLDNESRYINLDVRF